ncbi:MAG: PKD domain-containing protein [Flavobacteriales bacterium]|nr:PKD domain-containing protein [Flavobacteriales bacterium]
MKHLFRSFAVALLASTGLSAFAQPLPPYDITISGYVLGCTPNSSVNLLAVQGTQPAVNIDVPLDANCGFAIDLLMDSYEGWFQVSTPCNGAIQQTSVNYMVNALNPDSNVVYVLINCGNVVVDCEGVVGGSALPGTPCDDGDPNTFGDAWTANCMCAGGPALPCEACFGTIQANTPALGNIPFEALFNNCSSGGLAPYTYAWSWDGGITYQSGPADTAYVFTEGSYVVCLAMTDANGCTSTMCDSVVVDANGTINPVNAPTCEAAFFVMQAYQWVDSAANPNGGGGEPIPNQLWLWNLSSGNGNFQYLWNWGDGSASSEAYPTHTYSGPGTYTICLTIGGPGCTDTYCQDVIVDGDGILGGFMSEGNRSAFTVNVMNPLALAVTELPAFSGLTTWPNPAQDVLHIGLDSRIDGVLRIRINDLSGRVVAAETRILSDGRNNLTIPVSALSAGSYLITVENGGTLLSQRFVKVR